MKMAKIENDASDNLTLVVGDQILKTADKAPKPEQGQIKKMIFPQVNSTNKPLSPTVKDMASP